MGLKLAGIAINTNFDRNIEQLAEAFEWAIVKIDESEFEKALSISSSIPEDIFYVYFSANGTLIISPLEWALEKYHSIESDSMSFAFSETSMTYLFSYQDKHSNYRGFREDEGERHAELGKLLEIEKLYPNASGLIYKLIEDLIGKKFHSIKPDEIVFKCRKLTHIEYLKRSERHMQKENEIERQKDDKRTEEYMKEIGLNPKDLEKQLKRKKNWWRIWK